MDNDIIKIFSLSKVYKNQKVGALNKVTFSVRRGAIFGIIGTSGAGKSTLLRCLSSLDTPTEGEIWLSGEKLSPKRRKDFGMIFQHFNLFDFRNVVENITYPLEIDGVSKSDAVKRAQELISLVRLEGKEHLYPAQLSGGEKQRVAIARALARNPKLLFSDEATSALDPHTKKAILALLSDLNKKLNLTILLITHEMEVVKEICTDVAVLEKGEIVEIGTVEDLFTSPKHPTTQRFLQTPIHADIPQHLFTEGNELLHLYFKGSGAKEPIISRLIKNFDIEVNILLGGLDTLKTTVVGHLLISLSGKEEERNKAKQFLKEKGVIYEAVTR